MARVVFDDPAITRGYMGETVGALSPGGLLDVKGLGGTAGTLDAIGGGLMGIDRLARGMIIASGERAKARAARARAQQTVFQAEAIRTQGQFAVRAQRRAGQEVVGEQVAYRGYQGVPLSGSSLDVLEQTATDAAWNTSVVRYDYATRENSARYDARLLRYEAKVHDFNADQAKVAAISGAISAISGGFMSGQRIVAGLSPGNSSLMGFGVDKGLRNGARFGLGG